MWWRLVRWPHIVIAGQRDHDRRPGIGAVVGVLRNQPWRTLLGQKLEEASQGYCSVRNRDFEVDTGIGLSGQI